MKIEVVNYKLLKNVPSGSGIAKYRDAYYVVGDDAPFLFKINKQFDVIAKSELLDNAHQLEERIAKSLKPDFECLEMIGEDELVVFGSGSKSPQRDVFMLISLRETLSIERYSITEFYNKLRGLPIFKNCELNIEAVAFADKKIYLFNRGKNLIITFVYEHLMGYLRGNLSFPALEITEITLPKIMGLQAGFSGATALKNEPKIIFTASVEDTNNAFNDGEILGSFVGVIQMSETNQPKLVDFCLIPKLDQHLKVESVTVEEEISVGKTKIVLITDDDLGNSVVLESLITY